MSLTILLTNIVLWGRSGGTEVVTEQLADGLRRRGHRVMVFTPQLGALGQQMRSRGHIVIDKPGPLPWRPDVIHAHHTGPAMAALAANPGVPALFVCHDATAPFDAIPQHPRIQRLLAVDERCRARLVAEGASQDSISLLPNAVDLTRIQPRLRPVATRPQSALAVTKHAGHLPVLRQACKEAGIVLEEFGSGPGRVSDSLEQEYANTDLVFATARTALEAAASGAGVIVCDERGCAGFLTRERAHAWLPWNLGAGVLKDPTSLSAVTSSIAQWSAQEVAEVAELVRMERGLDVVLDQLEEIYRELLRAPAPINAEAETVSVGGFISGWVPNFDLQAPWRMLAEAVSPLRVDPFKAIADEVSADREQTSLLARKAGGIADEVSAHRGQTDLLATLTSGIADEVSVCHERINLLAGQTGGIADQVSAHHERTNLLTKQAASIVSEVTALREQTSLLAKHALDLPPILSALQTEIAELKNQLEILASLHRDKGKVWDHLRSIWRRVVPLSIRGPLHRLRHNSQTREPT